MGNSDHVTVGRCVLAAGKQNPRHYHPNCEEVLHVLSGSIEHYVDGEGWFAMNEGDTISIAQGVWHHARNIGDDEAHLLICFSSEDRKTIGEDD
jgi:quercetin dioxygenase-like cupin family protein